MIFCLETIKKGREMIDRIDEWVRDAAVRIYAWLNYGDGFYKPNLENIVLAVLLLILTVAFFAIVKVAISGLYSNF